MIKPARCMFCGKPGVHQCPGGDYQRNGPIFRTTGTVLPGLVDADAFPTDDREYAVTNNPAWLRNRQGWSQ